VKYVRHYFLTITFLITGARLFARYASKDYGVSH